MSGEGGGGIVKGRVPSLASTNPCRLDHLIGIDQPRGLPLAHLIG